MDRVSELAVVALITALTAGVGEELFSRRWLQTRLEAALGGWPGILVASLVFAFMLLAPTARATSVVTSCRSA